MTDLERFALAWAALLVLVAFTRWIADRLS